MGDVQEDGHTGAPMEETAVVTLGTDAQTKVAVENDIMCGACGLVMKRNAYQFCVRCGVKLNPESVWDAKQCNSTHDTPNIARVREEMIGRLVKVVIADGRIFIGRFLAFDKQRNMILSESREYRRVKLDDGPEKEEKRNAGSILIGGKFIKTVFWAKLTEEGKQKMQKEKEEEEERRRKEASEAEAASPANAV